MNENEENVMEDETPAGAEPSSAQVEDAAQLADLDSRAEPEAADSELAGAPATEARQSAEEPQAAAGSGESDTAEQSELPGDTPAEASPEVSMVADSEAVESPDVQAAAGSGESDTARQSELPGDTPAEASPEVSMVADSEAVESPDVEAAADSELPADTPAEASPEVSMVADSEPAESLEVQAAADSGESDPVAESEDPMVEAEATVDAGELLGDTGVQDQATEEASDEAKLLAIVEALIYVTEEPLTLEQLSTALEQPQERVSGILEQLVAEFSKPERGLTIREIAGGYKMGTKPEHHDAIRTFVKKLKPPLKLSLAALETLAVIAYKQPITAPEIMDIRGVQGAGVLKTLLDRKMIAPAGRKNVVGKPVLYKTTKEFLLQFGLRDLAELPTLKEFEELRRLAFNDADEPLVAEPVPSPEPVAATPVEAATPAEPEIEKASPSSQLQHPAAVNE